MHASFSTTVSIEASKVRMNTEKNDQNCLADQGEPSSLNWLDELSELDWNPENHVQIAQQPNGFSCISADISAAYATMGSFSSEVMFPETTDKQSHLSVDVPVNQAKESTTFQTQSTTIQEQSTLNHNNSMCVCQHYCGHPVKSLKSLGGRKQIYRSILTCQFCGKTFVHRGALRVHIRIHTGERPYVCPQCSSSFKQSGHLTAHMRTHSDERPFACHICSATFRQSTAAISHIRRHTNEKPFCCSICAVAFRTKQRLQYHLNMHTGTRPYVCSLCPAAFYQKTTLESHQLIHIDSKPHCCSQCPKTFRQKSSLAYHLRMHSGEKPYPCEMCGKQFRSSSNLRVHTRIHL